MKLIILTGPASCGKTSTLRITYDDLISTGAISTAKKQEGANLKDFSDVLDYKGKKIGILTMGDYAYRVIEFLDECDSKGYDIFITACNDRFKKPFKRFGAYPVCHIITKVKAASASLELSENASDAATIVGLI